MLARARAFRAFDSFTCTGDGGYPEELKEYDDCMITQVATGLFGVKEDTIKRVPIIEFKYAQGAKLGLGGHLLGDKVTPAVAQMRESVEGSALFSPFPFHSVYSVDDHKKHVDWIKQINPKALVAVKVSTPTDVDMVAVGTSSSLQFRCTTGETVREVELPLRASSPSSWEWPQLHCGTTTCSRLPCLTGMPSAKSKRILSLRILLMFEKLKKQ